MRILVTTFKHIHSPLFYLFFALKIGTQIYGIDTGSSWT